ncbi:hypothetical protein AX16_005617 [Volvariella volvacea WC 439]|nr:hypothetical protein AX16_005617 [Volvariella volvacea WC 439]
MVLYPLYVLAEIAIISTDLAELLGSAIGICLIFPQLPLWAGVLLTAVDVLVFLAFTDTNRDQHRPARIFEIVITILVFSVFGCFIALLVQVRPRWPEVFLGYIPSEGLFQSNPDAVYSAVGILGATIMPHALFLGSCLATQDRVSLTSPPPELSGARTESRRRKTARYLASLFRIARAERAMTEKDYRTKHGDRENNSQEFIKKHLTHGVTDIIASLLALAVPINSAILILAATVFYNDSEQKHESPAGLFEAHDLIKTYISDGAGFIFALALLCAGQVSSITATLAGQIVSEGFIEWRISPFSRRLLTRLISLIPSVAVAVAVGPEGINNLLVASQVVLSVVLPFVAFPLIYLTSSGVVMRVRVRKELPRSSRAEESEPSSVGSAHRTDSESVLDAETNESKTPVPADVVLTETIDFSNRRWLSWLAYMIWVVVLVANAYAIVMLAMGNGTGH